MGLPPERLSAEGTSLLDSRKSIRYARPRAEPSVRMNENCSSVSLPISSALDDPRLLTLGETLGV